MDDSCNGSDQCIVASFHREHSALQLVFATHLPWTSAFDGLRNHCIGCFAHCHAQIPKSMAGIFWDFIAATSLACGGKDNGRHRKHLLWLRSIFLGDTPCVGLAGVEFGIFVPGAESTWRYHIQTKILILGSIQSPLQANSNNLSHRPFYRRWPLRLSFLG